MSFADEQAAILNAIGRVRPVAVGEFRKVWMTSNAVREINRYFALSLFIALQAFSTSQRNSDVQVNANKVIRVQICLPKSRVYFNEIVLERLENHPQLTNYSLQQLELAPKIIRRVAYSSDPMAIKVYGIGFGEVLVQDGIFSQLSGFVGLQDSTVANQSIYEPGYRYPASEYIAMDAHLPKTEREAGNEVAYWFVLPKSIPETGFTDWFIPISMEAKNHQAGLGWRLVHGGKLEIYPVSIDPPKMRVSLMERYVKHIDPLSDVLPALTTARIKYRTAASSQQFAYEFVPKSSAEIPACD